MRIVYHLGAHCTDEERLVRCLLKNRATLADQGILVPAPTRYRKLLRDTAVQLKGAAATVETQSMVLEQIMDEDSAERLILSWDSFLSFPQWVLRGTIYGFAGERIRAFTQIFPQIEAEFHLAIRNPATFLPALFDKQKAKTHAEFMEGCDPLSLRWSTVVAQIVQQNPGVPLTIWADEDTPLIWPEVLAAVSGHAPGTKLDDTDELLALIISADGLSRMRNYIAKHPPETPAQQRRITLAFLDKFARPDRVEMAFSMPDWTADMVAAMTETYLDDIAQIRAMPGVTFLSA
ncbi:hypothetical protein Q9295_10265 [Xinfangfangia sp. CPCC 101601]|uniref:DUF1835 domain-containing protein n=1 Tax=Pseudogemmobacter lacusdianii TaxID=3069608 RepID=A0ABU0VYC3_9RHOB|nr:hypothetical protein [Xinfangfangia sp. CPCC 101601]MDQ2066761.1 hypothetical protein [Xinfangfangia sp. CPCC 101601]